MRIFIVINESRFFQTAFLASFLERTPDTVVGAALVTKLPPKNDMEGYLRKNWVVLKPGEMIKLGWTILAATGRQWFRRREPDGSFHSVRDVLDHFHIDTFEVEYDINQPRYLDRIRQVDPDIILSSNPLIFKQEILDLPRICCLNRHSALLPSYAGVWPIFQARLHGESYTGVSVHTMNKRIDAGIVLAQRKVPILGDDTIWALYHKCFSSCDEVLEAIEKVRAGDITPCPHLNGKASYYSYPTRRDWREFRARGGRFI